MTWNLYKNINIIYFLFRYTLGQILLKKIEGILGRKFNLILFLLILEILLNFSTNTNLNTINFLRLY